MASNELKARVHLDVSDAKRKLNSLIKKIQQVNAATKKSGSNSSLENQAKKATAATSKLANAQSQVWRNSQKIAQAKAMEVARTKEELAAIKQRLLLEGQVNRANQLAADAQQRARQREIKAAQQAAEAKQRAERRAALAAQQAWERAAKKQKQLNNEVTHSITSKIKGIMAAYAGVQGVRALVNTSDIITGAENRLNYANGGDTAATEQAMDKMYAASIRSRSNYGDMMANVGKSMALAGDKAFQGNIDNAIRFQEVMAKSYAIGGASAAEQSSSMYQMVQALGAGVLQGDELRSVREGAPLAYNAIEKFAQGVLNSEESLKDLASQGKITSDIVVAAMLEAGNEIDTAFKNTNMTIGQTLDMLKATAVNSFRAMQDTINKFINSDVGKRFIKGMRIGIQILIKVLNVLLQALVKTITWFVDNWSWISPIIYAIGVAILWLATVAIGITLKNAVVKIASYSYISWLPWLLLIGAVIAIMVRFARTASTGCEFVYNALKALVLGILALLGIVLIAYIITGTIMLSIPMLIGLVIIAVVASVVMAIVKYGEQIGGYIGALCGYISAQFNNSVLFVKKLYSALSNWFGAVCDNIGIFFNNLWYGAQASFWDFIHSVLEGISWLERPFNAIAKLFNLEGVTLSGITTDVANKANTARSKIQSNKNLLAAWNEGLSAHGDFQNLKEAWISGGTKGARIGAGIQD